MMHRFGAAALALLLLVGLVGCSSKPEYQMRVEAATVDGDETLGMSAAGEPVTGLIVYFHGSDQDVSVIQDDRKHIDFFNPLLRAGYAVVAAEADGNAFGNPASRQAYRRLIAAAQKKYVVGPLFFVAESMGTLAALALVSEDTGRLVKGMVGITPLMGLPPAARNLGYIAGPWGGPVPESADPLAWAPATFAGRDFLLYAADKDDVIPATASARAFADRFGTVAHIEVEICAGGHVASDCYQGDSVQKWMAKLR